MNKEDRKEIEELKKLVEELRKDVQSIPRNYPYIPLEPLPQPLRPYTPGGPWRPNPWDFPNWPNGDIWCEVVSRW